MGMDAPWPLQFCCRDRSLWWYQQVGQPQPDDPSHYTRTQPEVDLPRDANGEDDRNEVAEKEDHGYAKGEEAQGIRAAYGWLQPRRKSAIRPATVATGMSG